MMLSAIYVAAALVVTSAQYAVISTAIGTGTAGYGGDGGQATASELNYPSGVTVYANQNIFIADSGNNVVRLVAPSGIISTVVGTGVAGYAGDGGPATAARLDNPISIAFDGFGNFVIADNLNHRIREVTPSGIISTVAGTGACGYSGDGGPATAAELCDPMGVLFDAGDNLLFVAYFNNCVRKVTPSGVISTVAGTGVSGFSGDGGPATLAKLGQPTGIAVDASGNLMASFLLSLAQGAFPTRATAATPQLLRFQCQASLSTRTAASSSWILKTSAFAWWHQAESFPPSLATV